MSKRSKEPWEKTRTLYGAVPAMTVLNEAKLRSPSFKVVLDLVRPLVVSTPVLKLLFSEQELQYVNYTSTEPVSGFLGRLVQFVDSATGKRLCIDTRKLVGPTKDSAGLHKLLQEFYKAIQKGRYTAGTVKQIKKVSFLKSVAEKVLAKSLYGRFGRTGIPARGRSPAPRKAQPTATVAPRPQSTDSSARRPTYTTMPPSATPWMLHPIKEEDAKSIADASPNNTKRAAPTAEDAELERVRKAVEGLIEILNRDVDRIRDLRREKAALEESAKRKQEELAEAQKSGEGSDDPIGKQREELEAMEKENAQLKLEEEEKERTAMELRQKIDEKERMISGAADEKRDRVDKLRHENEQLRTKVAGLNTPDNMKIYSTSISESEVESKKAQIATLKKENEEIQRSLDKTKAEYEEKTKAAKVSLETHTKEVNRLLDEKASLNKDLLKTKKASPPAGVAHEEKKDSPTKKGEDQLIDESIASSKESAPPQKPAGTRPLSRLVPKDEDKEKEKAEEKKPSEEMDNPFGMAAPAATESKEKKPEEESIHEDLLASTSFAKK